MSCLIKQRLSTTYIPGDSGQPGYPGSPAIPAYCTTVTTSQVKTELVLVHPGIAPPYCTIGELLPAGYGLGATCPIPPYYAVVAVEPTEYIYTTREVCYPAVDAVPPIPYVPPTPSQTIIDYNLGWQSGANSISQLSQGAFEFSASVGTQGAVVGLSVNEFSSGYSDIPFAFHITAGNYRIMENGVAVTGYTTFTDGQVFKVERQGDEVKYYVDDSLVYTSLQTPTSEDYFLKAVMYAGDDTIVDASMSVYAAGTGAITLGALEVEGLGHNPTDNYGWTDLPALTTAGTGSGVSYGEPELPALRSHAYADFEAVGYSFLPGLTSTGHLTNSNGIEGEGGIAGGTGYLDLPALTSFAYEPNYEYSMTDLPALTSAGQAGLMMGEFVSADIAIFAPRQGYCHGITGEVGTGGATLPEFDALASEGVYGESYTEIPAPTSYGLSNIFGGAGGGILNEYVPFTFSLNATGKKKTSGLNTFEGEVPSFSFTGFTGGSIIVDLPTPTLSITGTFPAVGRMTKKVPSLSILATGRTGNSAAAIIRTPDLTLVANSGGQLVSDAPSITISATASSGSVGSSIIKVPKIKFVGQGTVNGQNRLVAEVPSLAMGGVARLTGMTPKIWMRSTATTVIASTGIASGYNVNTKNGAVTSHDYMPIVKIVQWGNDYYGVGTNGVYKMEGLTVDDEYPAAELSITGIGDESTLQKKMSRIYFRHRSSGDVTIEVTPDEGTARSYTLYKETGDVLATRRAKIARGMDGRSWELKVTGPALDIDSIHIPLKEVKRRLG